VFDKRVLRRIFRPRREAGTGGWRKLQSEEFHNLYFSPNTVRMISGHVARVGR
jgi:hypothetical protein